MLSLAVEFVTARVAGVLWSTLMGDRFSTGIFAEPIAKERMSGNVSESAAEGSPDRNALIAGEHRPEIRNSNGVFRVMDYLGALQTPGVMSKAKIRRYPHQASRWT